MAKVADNVAYSHTSMPMDAVGGSKVPFSTCCQASSRADTDLVHHTATTF